MLQAPDIWQKRLNVFISTVDGYLDWLDRSTPPRGQTAQVLLNQLKSFTQRQFDRFNNFQDYLEHSPKPIIPFLMPDTALCLILDQAFTDFSVIQLAISQRLVDNTRERLEIADRLAWVAIDPARKFLDSEYTTVLSYLHKSTNVRLIPYAPVAVFGIPYTGILTNESGQFDASTAVTQDFLGIPHEIGHHIFWHCNTHPGGQAAPVKLFEYLKDALKDDDSFVTRWAEEIFADVYSLAIGGPLIAKAGQSIQQVIAADKFFSDDGEHPTSALRPRITAKILKDMKYEAQSEALLQDWLAFCEARKACLWTNEKNAENDWFKIYEDAQWVPIEWVLGATANLNSQKAIDKMVLKLLELDVITSLKASPAWWKGYLNILSTSSLYEQFNTYLQQTIIKTPLTVAYDSINAENWNPDMVSLFPEIEQKADFSYTEPVLRFILKINGWATKGADRDPIPRLG
jgi:hypothetical protein